MKPAFSCYQALPLLEARKRGLTTTRSSFDLGCSEVDITLDEHGVSAASSHVLDWPSIERIADTDSVCFVIDEGQALPLRIFSEVADRSFQLWPTPTSPALLISGFLMHRIRDVAPDEGAARMARALGKIRGRLLDTTTGLGYAAIAAAHSASEVVTIEVEPVVRELARSNPWSRELFENPKIHRRDGDSSKVVPTLEPESFSAIIHDPPAINLAGELYSAAFYGALHRVLTKNGKLFHYIGDADSPSGARTTRGVVKRLREAGFSRVTLLKDSFGVLASA
jgi:predicted methyltransferase